MAHSTVTTASEVAREMAKQSEAIILSQLQELVSRGLLVIKQTEPVLVQDPFSPNPYQFTMQMKVRLRLKDQEYIEGLEKKIAAIKKHMDHPMKDLNWLHYLQHEILDKKIL